MRRTRTAIGALAVLVASVSQSYAFTAPVAPVCRLGGAWAAARHPSAVPPARRPRSGSCLNQARGGGGDFVDSVAGRGPTTVEEQLAELKAEIASQAALAAEADANMTPEEKELEMEMVRQAELVKQEEEEEELTDDGDVGFLLGMFDELKNITWPKTRRIAQLSFMVVVGQIFVISWILGANSFARNVPVWTTEYVHMFQDFMGPTW